ncbi:MAG: N-acetylneuraminate synthase [Terracidiphilus sp.]
MQPVFIIAEAGVNHNGSLDLALSLIDAAKAAGADAVKFQTFRADNLATATAHKAAYQERTTSNEETQFQMLKRLELDAEAHERLIEHCRTVGIQFLSSPFDIESADLLEQMDVPLYKIPSGEITNLPYLRHIGRKGKPVILSTGMSTLVEVEEGVQALRESGGKDITLLHCVTEYPAPFDEINLRAMHTLHTAFGLPVGYSDHTPGTEIAIAAVALGAVVIEKHFTLDRNLPGPDHAASLEPSELKQMVSAIRHVESALGNGIKTPAKCEIPNMSVARKSLVASRTLQAGHKLEPDDLAIKRPGNGIAPRQQPDLIGRTLRCDVQKDDLLRWDHLA